MFGHHGGGGAAKHDLKAIECLGAFERRQRFSMVNSARRSMSRTDVEEHCVRSGWERESLTRFKFLLCVALVVDVLCWGSLTEPAILVNHCLATKQEAILKKLRFIAHWTNSRSVKEVRAP